jgi:hypothetical protein
MKHDPGMHIVMQLVFFGKTGVRASQVHDSRASQVPDRRTSQVRESRASQVHDSRKRRESYILKQVKKFEYKGLVQPLLSYFYTIKNELF